MENVWFYKGYFILKDIAGECYNVYPAFAPCGYGYASLEKVMEVIDAVPLEIDLESSGSPPDENIKNTKMEGNCENEKND